MGNTNDIANKRESTARYSVRVRKIHPVKQVDIGLYTCTHNPLRSVKGIEAHAKNFKQMEHLTCVGCNKNLKLTEIHELTYCFDPKKPRDSGLITLTSCKDEFCVKFFESEKERIEQEKERIKQGKNIIERSKASKEIHYY